MSKGASSDGQGKASRRDFLKASTAGALAGGLGIARGAHAAGSDEIKVALIGCGGRGTGAAVQALSTKANVKLVAMADAFRDRVERSVRIPDGEQRVPQPPRQDAGALAVAPRGVLDEQPATRTTLRPHRRRRNDPAHPRQIGGLL